MFAALLDFWQLHTPIFSILLPAFAAFSLILVGYPSLDSNKHKHRLRTSRIIGLAATLLGFILAINLLVQADQGVIRSYYLGEWAAPFGIALVLDRLSALMIMLTYALALPVLWYATGGWDQKGRYFHAMFQFQLMGLCGAFLTGDLFNLFVFFEILLLASYVLLLHGQGRIRFRMGVHYVVLNLTASAIFLIGLAMVYGNVGSLNMADVARLLPTLESDQFAMAQAAGMILLVVFAIKAAIVPLSFWLPNTYAAASPPVMALFAIMTKVGVYSILRVNGTIFAAATVNANQQFMSWLLPIALLSSLIGIIGALAAHSMRRLVSYMLLSSVGTILIGIALPSIAAWSAALFYLIHSTLVVAAFYLLVEWISYQRSAVEDTLHPAIAIQQPVLLGISSMVIMMMIAGLPPFSGFLGKVMLLRSATELPGTFWIFLTVLLVSFISLITLVRMGITVFWRVEPPNELIQSQYLQPERVIPHRLPLAFFSLLALLLLLMVFASPVRQYTSATAAQLQNAPAYQKAVLQYDASNQPISRRPFDSSYLPYIKNTQSTAVTDNLEQEDVIEDPALVDQAKVIENPPRTIADNPAAPLPAVPTAGAEPATPSTVPELPKQVSAELKPARSSNAP
ncbi:monovalent cation/H+ antiporter subunit D [Alkanindiges illinoisensis]|nr:monovalent cation/H+ antiporter subunit D [Alkanindiges illinoisensis]